MKEFTLKSTEQNQSPIRTIDILGIPVHDCTRNEAVGQFRHWLSADRDRLHHTVTVNPEFVMQARRDPEFLSVLANADLATADGIGIVLAARLNGERIRERVTGVDLTEALGTLHGLAPRLFLLGAAPGVADQAAQTLRKRNPDVAISGVYSGSANPSESGEILDRINESGADTLLVAFGAPKQDIWIAHHRQELATCGIVLAIGVGGTFDYLAGRIPRAPKLIRRIGLEWLYRLIRQPWRWRRQLVLPQFATQVLRERWLGKGSSRVLNNGGSKYR